jgi:hypothetical protein
MKADFKFCERIRCKHFIPECVACGFTLLPYCKFVLDWNAQHVYSNKDGETFEDKEKMISWEDVPNDCPFKLEIVMERQ